MDLTLLHMKQRYFSEILIPRLIDAGIKRRFGVVVVEVARSPIQAQWNANHCATCKEAEEDHIPDDAHLFTPIGISRSLHILRLAIDLALFKIVSADEVKYLTESESYEPLGVWWEDQSAKYRGIEIECCWGGRFRRPDGGHFSVAHEGRR